MMTQMSQQGHSSLFECILGNYGIRGPVRIWKRYIPLLIDLLISNNFSSMTFFFAQRVFYELPVVKVYEGQLFFLLIFLAY